MKDGSRGGLLCRFVRVLDSVHGRFEIVRFEGNCDLADLGHTLFRRVLRIFLHDTFLLCRLRPVFLKQNLADPSLARS